MSKRINRLGQLAGALRSGKGPRAPEGGRVAMFESLEQRRMMTVVYNGHAGIVDGDHLALIQPGRVTAPAPPAIVFPM
jgi:hypothetical protein